MRLMPLLSKYAGFIRVASKRVARGGYTSPEGAEVCIYVFPDTLQGIQVCDTLVAIVVKLPEMHK